MSTETPRTDAETTHRDPTWGTTHVREVHVDFARQLERELINKTAQLEAIRSENERLKGALLGPDDECTRAQMIRKLIGHLHSGNLRWSHKMEMSEEEQNDWITTLETVAIQFDSALSPPDPSPNPSTEMP